MGGADGRDEGSPVLQLAPPHRAPDQAAPLRPPARSCHRVSAEYSSMLVTSYGRDSRHAQRRTVSGGRCTPCWRTARRSPVTRVRFSAAGQSRMARRSAAADENRIAGMNRIGGMNRDIVPDPMPRRGFPGWRMVWVLAVTETVSYGVLFYSFAVFLVPVQRSLGWSQATLTGAFSVSVLVTGVAAVPAGAWLDRHGARLLMSAGSVLAGACVAAWAGTGNVASLYWRSPGSAWRARRCCTSRRSRL
jgi:hypothetical protein